MKKRRKIAIIVAIALPLLYAGTYCTLRIKKYFVRQEFLTFNCRESIRTKYPNDAGSIKEGHTSYAFESERNQIGCGRIQKRTSRLGESILLPLYDPLGELEMRIRGFNRSTMYVRKYVEEFERFNSESNKVYFSRQSWADEFVVSRNEQTF
jgi:hypothetical protein